MKIEVKKTHIRRGEKNEADSCPIALAIKEGLSVRDIHVGSETVTIGKKKFRLPPIAIDFIQSFDLRKSSVGPIEFEI